jgi:hypothetical protein
MANFRDMLTARAATVFPGRDYNAFREKHDVDPEARQAPLHFEDVVVEASPETSLAQKILPSFARFLSRKKVAFENPSNILVALFLGETCYVLPGEALLDLFCEVEGISRAALHGRMSRWITGSS